MRAWIPRLQRHWEAAVGEMLVWVREPRNAHDRYAVTVKKDGTVFGPLAIIICGGKIFMCLIFMVEGTHGNFNTMKISAYTVQCTFMYYKLYTMHVKH